MVLKLCDVHTNVNQNQIWYGEFNQNACEAKISPT